MKKLLSKKRSAFIVMAMLFAASAHAQIVYTDVDPDLTITQTPVGSTVHDLDINNDGITDATLTATRTATYRAVFLGPSNGSEALVCCPQLLTKSINNYSFIGSDPSGTGGYWSTAQLSRLRELYFATGGGGGWGGNPVPAPPIGEWINATDRYLAIRFSVDGEWHYGWVRISVVSVSPSISFTIRDYAYNSVPGAGIFAGETECSIPFGLAVNDVDSNSVVLNWQPLSADTCNLRYRPTGTDIWSVIDTLTTDNFTFAGFPGCTEYEFQVEAVCEGFPSGYSESVIHTTDGCCSVPGTTVVDSVGETSANLAWGGVTAANSYDMQISADGGDTWELITGIDTGSFEFTGLNSCASYIVQVRTVCNGGTTEWSTAITFETVGCGACTDLTYCSSYGDTYDEWIARVEVGALYNESGDNNGYGDFTGPSTELQIGQGHPITLVPGYSSIAYPEYFKVFVDFDQNGDFNGPGELAYNAGVFTTEPISGILNIPAGAMEGRTRMRVVMVYGVATAPSCGWNEFGETEDYCVYLANTPIGVEESSTSSQVQVFPNPFTSILTVSMGMNKSDVTTCTVRALTGQTLLTRTVATAGGSSTITLDLASLTSGTYLLEMQTGDERIVRKVVKE